MMRRLAACIVFVFVASCASLPAGRGYDEEGLKRDVQILWNAKIHGDWDVVYDLMTADYRSKVSRSVFIKRASVIIKSYKIDKIETIDDSKAIVSIDYVVAFQASELKGIGKETWLREGKQWKLYAEPERLIPYGRLPSKPSN